MAIPIGNHYVDRVFSIMKKVWTDERNRLNIKMIQLEICIKMNFFLNCHQFKSFVENNDNLIKATKKTQNKI